MYTISVTIRFTSASNSNNVVISAVQTTYYSGSVAATGGNVFVASTSFTGYFASGDAVQVNVYCDPANSVDGPFGDSVVTVTLH